MRLDKFLKVSRIIKRRSVANEACSKGCVLINSKQAKPSAVVKVGDVLELTFGQRTMKYEVLKLVEHVQKQDAETLYRVVDGR